MGAGLEIDTKQLDGLQESVSKLARQDFDRIADAIGAEVESQVRRRIDTEKRAPDGAAWEPWSRNYAKTRGPQHSLLVGEGHLRDSITRDIRGRGSNASQIVREIEVGSNLVYAATHQHGRGPIPARPFLGLSSNDEEDVLAVVDDFVRESMRDAGL
jgi:phage virion morphogenesis protein